MKRIRFVLLAALCLMVSATCFADGRMIPVDQLPDAAKAFVKTHFPESAIMYAEMENEAGAVKYEVKLNDGTELDFDKKGEWDKVDCKLSAVPAVLVPSVIAEYVKSCYPGVLIVKFDKERYGCEVELSNGLELKFNKKGQLLSIDD